MGFWDKLIDGFKSAFGKGIKDSMVQNVENVVKSIVGMGGGAFMLELMDKEGIAKLLGDPGKLGVAADQNYLYSEQAMNFEKRLERFSLVFAEDEEMRQKLLEQVELMRDEFALTNLSIKDFGETLTKYSKDFKNILESLVKKTPWYDMAKSQKNIVGQWGSGNITNTAALQQINQAGLFKSN